MSSQRSLLNEWHEERNHVTKGPHHTTPAYPPGTWLQLTVERRWSEGGFQLWDVCAGSCEHVDFVFVHLLITASKAKCASYSESAALNIVIRLTYV